MKLRSWTITRASGVGVAAGGAALLLWPFHESRPEGLFWPFGIILSVSAFCGLSILWITLSDLRSHRRRGRGIKALRTFDVVLGALLLLLSALALRNLVGQLPAEL